MKKWIALIVVIGVGIGGYSVWNRKNTSVAATTTNTRPTTATISSRDIRFVVNAAGDIGPDDMVSVRPEVNGRISELPVDIGDEVKKGDLLCALNDRDLQTERASRMTDIEGAKLQLQQAQRVYERSQSLYADTLISQEVFQDSETTYKLAKNALDRSQKALDQVDDQLSKTRIVAPFDCTILTRPVSIGQAVSGSAGYNSGTEVMTIANLKEMIIMAHMNQADVIRLKAGQKVDVQVQAVPGLTMVGMVERVAPQATLKNNIKGFATQIRLKNIDPRVRPGMTANMTIPVASAENVLAIPIAAVFTEQGERYAYVRTGEQQFEMRPIELGISDYQFAQITGGLSDGEVVSLIRPQTGAVVKMPTPGT
ncbi:MAG TPA: efflux RND transporter periplasmic adaptor subunit, partial [Verrucomicrobiae bacterium]